MVRRDDFEYITVDSYYFGLISMESSSFLGRGDSTKTRKAVSLKNVWDLEIERNPFFGSQCNGIPGLLGMPVGTNFVMGYCERLWNGKKENQTRVLRNRKFLF